MAGEDQYWHENSGVIRREHGRNGGVVGHQRRTLATRTEGGINDDGGQGRMAWLEGRGFIMGRMGVVVVINTFSFEPSSGTGVSSSAVVFSSFPDLLFCISASCFQCRFVLFSIVLVLFLPQDPSMHARIIVQSFHEDSDSSFLSSSSSFSSSPKSSKTLT